MEEERACRIEGCKRPYRAKGYCNYHFKKWRQGKLPKSRYRTCGQEGCRKPMKAGGLCEEHLQMKGKKGKEAA